MKIETRERGTINTEKTWSEWAELHTCKPEEAEDRLAYWRSLNDYAISQWGDIARSLKGA